MQQVEITFLRSCLAKIHFFPKTKIIKIDFGVFVKHTLKPKKTINKNIASQTGS